jgi:hypothetical protein
MFTGMASVILMQDRAVGIYVPLRELPLSFGPIRLEVGNKRNAALSLAFNHRRVPFSQRNVVEQCAHIPK